MPEGVEIPSSRTAATRRCVDPPRTRRGSGDAGAEAAVAATAAAPAAAPAAAKPAAGAKPAAEAKGKEGKK